MTMEKDLEMEYELGFTPDCGELFIPNNTGWSANRAKSRADTSNELLAYICFAAIIFLVGCVFALEQVEAQEALPLCSPANAAQHRCYPAGAPTEGQPCNYTGAHWYYDRYSPNPAWPWECKNSDGSHGDVIDYDVEFPTTTPGFNLEAYGYVPAQQLDAALNANAACQANYAAAVETLAQLRAWGAHTINSCAVWR